MALSKYNGMQESMPNTFSAMLDRFFNETVNSRNFSGFTPSVDACETEKGFEIDLALPGVKKDDINIDFQEGKLTISGERRLENKEENSRFHMLETQYGSFSRSFYLPDNVDPDRIKANLSEGVLHVMVPKDEHKTMKRQINISSPEEEHSSEGADNQASGSGEASTSKEA